MEDFITDEESSAPETGSDMTNGSAPVCRLNDKLKAIRPFSESQLMALYSNEELEGNVAYIDRFLNVGCFLKIYLFYRVCNDYVV